MILTYRVCLFNSPTLVKENKFAISSVSFRIITTTPMKALSLRCHTWLMFTLLFASFSCSYVRGHYLCRLAQPTLTSCLGTISSFYIDHPVYMHTDMCIPRHPLCHLQILNYPQNEFSIRILSLKKKKKGKWVIGYLFDIKIEISSKSYSIK